MTHHWWCSMPECIMSAPVQKKVRDVKFCRETARVATVSADGTLMVLDAQLSLIRTVSGWLGYVHTLSLHHKAILGLLMSPGVHRNGLQRQ